MVVCCVLCVVCAYECVEVFGVFAGCGVSV